MFCAKRAGIELTRLLSRSTTFLDDHRRFNFTVNMDSSGNYNMSNLQIYVPTQPLQLDNGTLDTDCESIITQLNSANLKSIAYFDETIHAYILLDSEIEINGKLKVETMYVSDRPSHNENKRNGHRTISILDDPILITKTQKLWKHSMKIKPGRNVSKLQFEVCFEREEIESQILLKPFVEADFTEIANIDMISKLSIAGTEEFEKSTAFSTIKASYEIVITSLYRMSLKSTKASDKTLVWLDLSTSSMVDELETPIEILSIDVNCVGSELVPCMPLVFPLALLPGMVFTAAYKVSYDDGKLMKPLMVTINAVIDKTMNIDTQWTSSIDLSNNPTYINHSNSTSTLLNKNKQSGLLPALKFPKLRSYGNLISNSSPKLPPPRSSTTNTIPNSAASNNNNGMGGQRYTSVRIKSGSNLSLSQLWNGSASQSFQRGLVVTVSGPTKVKLGEKFRWKIQLLNKSSAKMDLILFVQSSIKKEYEKIVPPIPIQSAYSRDSVPLFSNNQLVRSFYYKFNRAGLVSLTNNLRVSLEYGNLYECDLELMSVERGMFNIYDFKVLDISTGDIFECNRLLDVLVI